MNSLNNNENISNVYFVIVDAMVPFNLAIEFGIINDEEIKKYRIL